MVVVCNEAAAGDVTCCFTRVLFYDHIALFKLLYQIIDHSRYHSFAPIIGILA